MPSPTSTEGVRGAYVGGFERPFRSPDPRTDARPGRVRRWDSRTLAGDYLSGGSAITMNHVPRGMCLNTVYIFNLANAVSYGSYGLG